MKKPAFLQVFDGADGRIRTGDLILTKDALYLLSYISMPFAKHWDILSQLGVKCKGYR